MSATAAYQEAYQTKRTNAAVAGPILEKKAHVAKRIQDLKDKIARKNILTRQQGLELLTKIALGDLTDIIGEDGEIETKALKKLGPALGAYSTSDSRYGKNRAAKLLDPIKAIERIAKIEGWDAPIQHQVEQVSFDIQLGHGNGKPAIDVDSEEL